MKKLLAALVIVLTLASCGSLKKDSSATHSACIFGCFKSLFETYRYNPSTMYLSYFQ